MTIIKKLFIIAVLLFISFIVFSREVKRGFLKTTDFNTTVRLQNKIPGRFDEIMDDGGILADPIASSALVMMVASVIFLKSKGKKRLLTLAIPLAFLALTILEIYGKNFVPHPGPPFFMIKHPTTIFPKFHVVEPYSYPSGHTARVTFLAAILFLLTIKQYNNKAMMRKRLWIIIGLICYVIFIAVSRIYLGHHWLSDIIGGALLGASFATASIGFLL